MTYFIGPLLLLTALAASGDTPGNQYDALAKEYDPAQASFIDANKNAVDDVQRAKLAENRPQPLRYVPRFFALAEQHPEDPAAVDALTWIASHCLFVDEGEKAMAILAAKYSAHANIAAYVQEPFRYGEPFASYEEVLRAVLKNNSRREIQAAACVSLACYLKMAREKSKSNLIHIALHGERAFLPFTLSNLKQLQERGLDNVGAEADALFERAIEQYGDIQLTASYPREIEKFAKDQLFELRNLAIGSQALEFEGQDISGKTIKLSDFRGQVVVLDFGSHEACGVCRAMYPQIRLLVEQFEKQPVAWIGINAWDKLPSLQRLAMDKEITWRVVWDGDREQGPISKAWVITSMPTIYILDRKGVIRNKGFLQYNDIQGTVAMLLKE